MQEFRQSCRDEAATTVKQAIAKIFYAKREFIQEVQKYSHHTSQIDVDRIERIEAEIAYLKDDMVTHS